MRAVNRKPAGGLRCGAVRGAAGIVGLGGVALLIVYLGGLYLGGVDFSRPLWAQQGTRAGKPRVPPPKFGEEWRQVFFDDVFSAAVGQRPRAGTPSPSGTPTAGLTSNASASSPTDVPQSAPAGMGRWQQLISAEVLENEVKAIKARLDKAITSPSDFAGRGYKACRTEFSELAVLFGVIQEYDGPVRWKADAAGARQAFARTAANCKVGSQQAYNDAKQRKAELEELIRGGSFAQRGSSGDLDWSALSDRAPLMIRLERAFEEQVRKSTAAADTFRADKDSLVHEAHIIAVLAEALCQPAMEDSGDSTYTGFARKMQSHALEIVEAAKRDDFAQARQAAGQIDQACSACHESYR